MTVSSHTKVLAQIRQKKAKYLHYLKYNKPAERSFGKVTKECVRCGSHRAHIAKYGLHLCRRCFRTVAQHIGFKKYS